MKKTILITLCCASLMLVTPLVGVAQQNQVSNNLPEQPNDVEGLVAQIRVVIDEILQRYGDIPMVRSLCNLIIKLDWFPGIIVSCIFLWMIFISSMVILGKIDNILYGLNINISLLRIFLVPFLILASILNNNCPPSTPIFWDWSFKSLYTLSETKDSINTFDGCPCLQE